MSDKETIKILPKDYPIGLYLEQQKEDDKRYNDLRNKFRRLRNER